MRSYTPIALGMSAHETKVNIYSLRLLHLHQLYADKLKRTHALPLTQM